MSATRSTATGASRAGGTEPTRWLREKLFDTPSNAVITLVTAALMLVVLRALLHWAFTEANWAVVPANFQLLMVGPYPADQVWRVWAGFLAATALAGVQWGRAGRPSAIAVALLGVLALFTLVTQKGHPSGLLVPLAAGLAAAGFAAGRAWRPPAAGLAMAWGLLFVSFVTLIGADLGQGGIPTSQWGGLMLTTLLSLVAIVASFPLGLLLGVGRASKLPIVSGLCMAYIEVVRGVPLVAVLFMAQLFVPLFLPDFTIDKIVRAMIGLTLFSAAYLAENVRGGLMALGTGQSEAARALGLNGTQTLLLIVLPQALRAVIPAIVGQFIALFKDTSLVAIIGLTDLLGVANAIVASPSWLGLYEEVFIAVAVIYGVCSYAMSLSSRNLERRLNAGRR